MPKVKTETCFYLSYLHVSFLGTGIRRWGWRSRCVINSGTIPLFTCRNTLFPCIWDCKIRNYIYHQRIYVKILSALWIVTVLYTGILIWYSSSWGSLWGSTARNKLCSLWSPASYEMISWNRHLPADSQDEADSGSQTAEYEWNLYSRQLC